MNLKRSNTIKRKQKVKNHYTKIIRDIQKYELSVKNNDSAYDPLQMIIPATQYDDALNETHKYRKPHLGKGIKTCHYAVNTKDLILRSSTEQWLQKQAN